jgi:fucose permease
MTQHGVALLLMGPVLPDLMREFSVRESLAGLLLSAGSLGFTVGPLVGGRFIDRRGVRAALLVGFAIELLALGLFGVVPAFALAVALNLLLRFGASFVETSVNVLPVTLRSANGASMMNLMHSFFGVGALLAPVSVGVLVQLTGRWRYAFWAGGLATAALMAAAWAVRLPRAARAGSEHGETAGTPLLRDGRAGSVRDPFVLAGAVALFLYVGAEVGMSSWVVLYLRTRLGFAPVAATAGLTLLWVGITAGRSINSLLARRIGVRELVLGGAVGGVLCGYALVAARSVPAVYALLLLFGVFVSGTFPNVMVSVNTRYPERVGQVTAVLTVAAAGGSMVFHPIIGTLSQIFGVVAVIVVPPTLMALLVLTYGLATRGGSATSG